MSPEPQGTGKLRAPGPRPGWLVLLASFWAPRVAALASPPAPGLEGKPGTPRSPCGAGWIYAGWGRGRGQRCSPGSLPGCSPCRVTLELENPKRSPTPVLREVWTLFSGQGLAAHFAEARRGSHPPRSAARASAALGSGAHMGLSLEGLEFPQHKMPLQTDSGGVTSISAGSGARPGRHPSRGGPGRVGEACQPWVKSVGAWPVMESCRHALGPGPQPSGQSLAC